MFEVRYDLKRLTEWANADIVCRSTNCTICLFVFNYPLIVIEKRENTISIRVEC